MSESARSPSKNKMTKISHTEMPQVRVNIVKMENGSIMVEVFMIPESHRLISGGGQTKAFLSLQATCGTRCLYGADLPPIFGPWPSDMEAAARILGEILARLTTTQNASAAYWAVNYPGDKTEWIGEFNEAEWASASIRGPQYEKWGRGTQLLPALKLAIERVHKDSDRTMAVFITFGCIGDEQECMDYCRLIAHEMHAGVMKPIKIIMIGVGTEVDEGQFERFEDMFDGTDLEGKVDLWSTGLVNSLKDELEIFAILLRGVMCDTWTVAKVGRVVSCSGHELASFPDGMPGHIQFTLPKGETLFRIHADGQMIEQDCSEVLGKI